MGKDLINISGGKRGFLYSLLLLFLIFFIVPLLFTSLGWNREPLLFQILFLLVLGGSFFLWEKRDHESGELKKIFALPGRGKRVRFLLSSALSGVLLQFLTLIFNLLTGRLFTFFDLPIQEQALAAFLKTLPFPELCLFFIPVLLLAPFAEEWVFRYSIYKAAEKEFSPLPAAFWQAGAFAFVHFNAVVFPGLFLLGLFLQWNVRRVGSLWGGVLPHFFFNLTGIILLLWKRGFF